MTREKGSLIIRYDLGRVLAERNLEIRLISKWRRKHEINFFLAHK